MKHMTFLFAILTSVVMQPLQANHDLNSHTRLALTGILGSIAVLSIVMQKNSLPVVAQSARPSDAVDGITARKNLLSAATLSSRVMENIKAPNRPAFIPFESFGDGLDYRMGNEFKEMYTKIAGCFF